ncbi:MAG TPA: ABC transporter permease [Terriglobia bacterium]|nr:ABC transporter permease [Terriglobia bacterium]
MTALAQDIKYTLRLLAKNPGFTAIAVIVLALGIGANTAIFSVVDAVVLQPLPIHQPGRVVAVHDQFTQLGLPSIGVSAPDFVDISRMTDIFANTAAITNQNFDLTGAGQPEHLVGFRVSGGYFPLVGVKPILGRWFLPSEDKPGASHVAVITENLWQGAFGSDPKLIGKSITLDGENYTVVGVMPSSFQLPYMAPDLWTPLALTPAQLDPVKERDHQWLSMAGRLRPGVTVAQAQTAMNGMARRLMREYPNYFPPRIGYGIKVVQLKPDLIGSTGKFLFVLLAAVGFVLLIACANVANLMLTRASARSREIAVRAALGASRLRIVRQLLTESVLLALAGGAIGLWLAVWGVQLLKSIGPANVPRLSHADMNGWVLLFTAGIALATGILFGLAPALQSSKTSLHESLKESGRSSSGSMARQRVRSLLVIGEVAFTLVLLAGGVLMIKSFVHLLNVNPGFDPNNVLTMQITLSGNQYAKPSQITGFYRALLERVSRLPGVKAAGAVDVLPFSNFGNSGSFSIEGEPASRGEILPHADTRRVMPGLFSTLRIPLRRGRLFTEADTASAPHVALIDDVLAKEYWPNQDPIGHRVAMLSSSAPEWYTVVGIVGNVRNRGFSAPRKGVLYFPLAQWPKVHMSLVVRTASDPMALAGAVRQAVRSIDRQEPVYDVKTMEGYVSESVSNQRLSVFLLAMFAGLALVLASVGIYGVISFSVSQRTHEIGIRMALGAQPGDVLRMVLGQGIILALAGVGIGIVAALGLTRFMASVLFGVKPTDLGTFAIVVPILIGVSLLASYIPARRAMKVDPLVALRYE